MKNKALLTASTYSDWTYEVVAETEKAVQIQLDRPNRSPFAGEWKVWLPKSVILDNKF